MGGGRPTRSGFYARLGLPLNRRVIFARALFAASAAFLLPAEPRPLAPMDDPQQDRSPKEKGTAELVEGKSGKAIRFTFAKDARSTFFPGTARGNAEWDKAAGFSFWVKGDGSDAFGGLEFIYEDD